MFLDVCVHHRPEVVIFTVPEQVYDENLREIKKLDNKNRNDNQQEAVNIKLSFFLFFMQTHLPVTGTPVVHICLCCRPGWRTRCQGCLGETAAHKYRHLDFKSPDPFTVNTVHNV